MGFLISNFKPSELLSTSQKIDNIPESWDCLENIIATAERMQIIREKFGKAIMVTSGYRTKAVNIAVGGSKSSAHLYGLAVDFKANSAKESENRRLWELVKDNIEVLGIDQAILYTRTGKENGSIKWIHVGWRKEKSPRYQVLFMA